jgi:putative flippase GtrA
MGRNLIEVVDQFPRSIQFKMKPGVKWGDEPVSSDRMIDHAVMGARSSFYGVFLEITHRLGTLWLLASIQCFLTAWVIYLLWRTMAPQAPSWSYLAVVAAAVVGTSISFFTTFAMPDIFAGVGGAALALILTQADRLRRRELVGLWLLCIYAMAVHKTHLGTGLVIGVCGAALVWILGLPFASAARRMALILSAALLAWAGGFVIDSIYQARTGLKLSNPPFMMARVLADGPGRAYMRWACAHGQPYALCRFQANVRDSTDLILWSDRKKLGVFNIADHPTRTLLEEQEMRFVIGTVMFDPLGQAWASLQNWGEQLVAYQVDDPLRNPAAYLRGRYWPTTALPKLIPNFEACRPPGDCRPPFKYKLLADWHGVVLGASVLLLLGRLCLKDVRQAVFRRGLTTGDNEPARVAAVILLLVAVAVVNAAICGILSGPFARYQSRLIWLVPVGAGLMMCALPMGFGALAAKARRLLDWSLAAWEQLRAQPLIGRFLPALDGHFVRFCVVGGLGFIVDFSVLKTVVYLGMSPIGGRGASFPVAVTATWLANRFWTFQHHQGAKRSWLRELSTYFAVQSAGFAANFAVYTAMIWAIPALHGRLLPPMVAGTAAGLVINYLGAKHIVFRRGAGAS